MSKGHRGKGYHHIGPSLYCPGNTEGASYTQYHTTAGASESFKEPTGEALAGEPVAGVVEKGKKVPVIDLFEDRRTLFPEGCLGGLASGTPYRLPLELNATAYPPMVLFYSVFIKGAFGSPH